MHKSGKFVAGFRAVCLLVFASVGTAYGRRDSAGAARRPFFHLNGGRIRSTTDDNSAIANGHESSASDR